MVSLHRVPPLRVASYNVYAGSPVAFIGGASEVAAVWSKRPTLQAAAMRDSDLDVIALQEVPFALETNLSCGGAFHVVRFEDRWSARFAGITLGMLTLVLATSGLTFAFGPPEVGAAVLLLLTLAFVWLLLSGGYHWTAGQRTCLVVLVRKRPDLEVLGVVERKTFREQGGDWFNMLNPRGFMGVGLAWHGRPLVVWNTHLSAYGSDDTRTRQASELAMEVIRHGSSHASSIEPAPGVVCGDFNATPKSRTMAFLRGLHFDHSGSDNSGAGLNTWDTEMNTMTNEGVEEPSQQIDYVLARGADLSNFRVEFDCLNPQTQQALSDHYGVSAAVHFR
jgi:hypothetical protein